MRLGRFFVLQHRGDDFQIAAAIGPKNFVCRKGSAMKVSSRRFNMLALLLLLPALALGPIGCGAELAVAVPIAVKTAAVIGVGAAAYHEVQKVKETEIDIAIKQQHLRQYERDSLTPGNPAGFFMGRPGPATSLPVYAPPRPGPL